MPEPNLDRWARGVEEQSRGGIWAGLGLTLLFHVVAAIVMVIILLAVPDERSAEFMFYPLLYMGLSQLAYMVPAILICRRRGSTETAKGMIIGASITFLLSAACTGLLFGIP